MKDRKAQKILFTWLIAAASFIILLIILDAIKITPLDVYHDPQYQFSLQYPAYWKKVDRPEQGMALVQFFVPQSSEFDKFAESVNIVLVDLSRKPGMTLQQFSSLTTKQLVGVFGDSVNVLETREIRMGGQPAFRFSYVTHAEIPLTGSKMKYLHVWTLRGQFAMILTFAGELKEFDENLRHVNRMIKTFKFQQ